jgi:hypothetical protein
MAEIGVFQGFLTFVFDIFSQKQETALASPRLFG